MSVQHRPAPLARRSGPPGAVVLVALLGQPDDLPALVGDRRVLGLHLFGQGGDPLLLRGGGGRGSGDRQDGDNEEGGEPHRAAGPLHTSGNCLIIQRGSASFGVGLQSRNGGFSSAPRLKTVPPRTRAVCDPSGSIPRDPSRVEWAVTGSEHPASRGVLCAWPAPVGHVASAAGGTGALPVVPPR